MTANQINWFNAQEAKRHNLATEKKDRLALKEQRRHNEAGEAISTESNQIQHWFNVQQAKHLERQDSINQWYNENYIGEVSRHNQMTESQAEEKIGLEGYELGIRQQQANTEWYNAQTRRQEAETESYKTSLYGMKTLSDVKVNNENLKLMEAKRLTEQYQAKYIKAKPYIEYYSTTGKLIGDGVKMAPFFLK